jgi:hypothetical protein
MLGLGGKDRGLSEPDEPTSALVPIHDERSGRVVAHYDPVTKRLRVKVWGGRRVWFDIRRLLDGEAPIGYNRD